MKAIRLQAPTDPPNLVLEDVLEPIAGPGEVLIAVHATGVTPSELIWYPTANTTSGEPRPMPIVLGHEFSGVIRAKGQDVTDVEVGDEVYGLNDWFIDGAEAEFCIAKASDVAPKPKSMDHIEAAAVPISALTAWQGLFVKAGLKPGDRVLVHGAAGAVGMFAVQLASYRGAQVIGTASSHNIDFVRELGATEAIDYKTARFEDRVRDVDVVFDTVGGDTLRRSWKVLRQGGKMITIAADSERDTDTATKEAFFIVEPDREQLTEIAALIDGGRIRSIVDSVYPLADARKAYEHKATRGKAVLQVVGSK